MSHNDEPFGTVEAYLKAFRAIQAKGAPENHFSLLRAHFDAPNHTTSWTKLADAIGYENGNAVNLQYGKFARRVAARLGIRKPPRGFWLNVLADWAPERDPDSGYTAFVLHRPVVNALVRLWGLPGRRTKSGIPLHIVQGGIENGDKRLIEELAGTQGCTRSWVVSKAAQYGDDVVIYIGGYGFFATATINSDTKPRADWPNRYGTSLARIRLITPAISLAAIRRHIPSLTWAISPRSITTPDLDDERRNQRMQASGGEVGCQWLRLPVPAA